LVKPYIVGCTFARGGSKGLPGKNIRSLAGKPLLAHAIEIARQVAMLDRIIVSTDSPEIATIARQYGAEVPFLRPAELAQDDSPELLAWRHAIRTLEETDGRKIDVLVSIPATAPLRTPGDVEKCIRTLLENDDADAVITAASADANPYFNMIVIEQGYARIAAKAEQLFRRRQDAPVVYDVASVAYAVRPAFVFSTMVLLSGKVKVVQIPRERSLDIDDEVDFAFAEFMMERRTRSASGKS
jgi:N-acylneuraminate cytidylyltransferase